jgi:ribonuclease-3
MNKMNKMNKMNNETLFITNSSDDEELICDKQSKTLTKDQIILKQIEEDLAIHDFSKPHVTREDIQIMIGMKIKNVSYYQRSLVHKSIHKAVKRYQGDNIQEYLLQHNERLEFLGDSVLSLIVANFLFHKYPDRDEGFLTRIKTKLVNGTQLAKLAKKIDLGKHILMSNHVQNIKGRDSQKILEDAFEALLAAIFNDLGFDAVNSFVLNIINTLDFEEILIEDNYKDLLLRYAQHDKIKPTTPEYILIGTDGPPHNRSFTVAVTINGIKHCEGSGKSKKQAEQIAAFLTLQKFKEIN